MTCLIAVPCDLDSPISLLGNTSNEDALVKAGVTDLDLFLCDRDGGRIDPVWRMQQGYEYAKQNGFDIIAYLHSDVEIYEQGWLGRCLKQFEDPTVGVVGFGGALGLGHPDIYKTPYDLQQLARFDYRSNTTDCGKHGMRSEGVCDVGTLDGFALIVRRDLLDKIGGWPCEKLQFHNYDNALCCYARRHGYQVRQVGVSCKHFGGGHSIKERWQKRCVEDFGMTDAQIHAKSHEWLYEEFRDVLPIRVSN